jgi:hypothetical protein
MSPIELYNAVTFAIAAGDFAKAAELLPKLAEKMEGAMMTRGWHKFPLVGDTAIDPLIERANRNLTG